MKWREITINTQFKREQHIRKEDKEMKYDTFLSSVFHIRTLHSK